MLKMDDVAVMMRKRRPALRLVGVRMFVITVVIMNVVMVMVVLVRMSMSLLVMMVIVVLTVGAQGYFRAGLKIGERGL